jgi:GTP-binding protein HflX
VASFKATLEEAVNADLLLHIVDVSSDDAERQAEDAKKVLAEIGCSDKKTLILLNKADIVRNAGQFELLQTIYPDALGISAKTGMNLDMLREKVLEIYTGGQVVLRITANAADGKIQNFIKANATVLNQQFTDNTIVVEVKLGKNRLTELERFKPEKIERIE